MKILLVDNDRENLESIKAALILNGYETKGYTDLDSAKNALQLEGFDVVITDFHLGENSRGTDLLDSNNKEKINIPIILLSGDPEIDLNGLNTKNKIYKYFKKPIDIVSLLEELKEIDLNL